MNPSKFGAVLLYIKRKYLLLENTQRMMLKNKNINEKMDSFQQIDKMIHNNNSYNNDVYNDSQEI